MKSSPDYFDAKDTVRRLEEAINRTGGRAIISPEEETPIRSAHDHVIRLSDTAHTAPKELLADFVVRRRDELERQMEELAFLQDVAALVQKHARFFEGVK